jgi:hypothetical protein
LHLVNAAAKLLADTEAWLGRAYGLRLLTRPVVRGIARGFVVAAWLVLLLGVLGPRPDLLRPADFGSDSSNYLAAGERLVGGGEVYRLSPGDRPAPADAPGEWNAPILSPPPISALWAPLALGPAALGLHVTWLAGVAGTTAVVVAMALSVPVVPLLLGVVLFLPGLAATALSGNINAVVGPVAFAAWLGARSRHAAVQASVGAVVGATAVAKLGPGGLVLWLLATGGWRAFAGAVLAGVVLAAGPALIEGWSVYRDYLAISSGAAATPTPDSIPGLLRSLGASPAVAAFGIVVVLVAGGVGVVLLRHRRRLAFALAVGILVYATPVVREESAALLFFVLIPWARLPPETLATTNRTLPVAPLAASLAAVTALAALAGSVATGGLDRSSVQITNEASSDVIVRFAVPAQSASYGFRVTPGATGWAWHDRVGAPEGFVAAFRPDCGLRGALQIPRTGSSLTVAGGSVSSDPVGATRTNEYLAYDAACAVEMKRLIEERR